MRFSRIAATAVLVGLAACGSGSGGGGDSGGGGGGGATTTVSGTITFDRVPIGSSSGLSFNSVTQAPARQVVVEAIQSSNSNILASATTDTSGGYSLTVPADTTMFVRAKAQMQSGSTWNFRVLNNANGSALYTLDGSSFNSGSSASTRNLHAASGWGGSSYTDTRAAAPFAILDTVYQAKQLLLGAQSGLTFPALDLYWSSSNVASDTFCPSSGSIGTTSFIVAASGDTDDCSTPRAIASGIYVLGFFSDPSNSDTDEFDQHVIAHEFGHYVEASFSRSDSIGGSHGFNEALDPRVAFGEGFGNAFSGMVLGDPIYRDSFGTTQVGSFDLDNNAQYTNGWYSEAAVGHILWDLFDSGVEASVDTVQVPFATLFSVFDNGEQNTPALTSMFSYAAALRAAAPADTQAIDLLLTSEGVNGTDEYGAGEYDFDGASASPTSVYVSIQPGGQADVCTTAAVGVYNKLNNRRFLRLDVASAGTRTITATGVSVGSGAESSNPQIWLWRQGFLALAQSTGGTETLTRNLDAGTYIIEVFDSQYGSLSGSSSSQQRCIRVTVN